MKNLSLGDSHATSFQNDYQIFRKYVIFYARTLDRKKGQLADAASALLLRGASGKPSIWFPDRGTRTEGIMLVKTSSVLQPLLSISFLHFEILQSMRAQRI
jgi:hypothetical protein